MRIIILCLFFLVVYSRNLDGRLFRYKDGFMTKDKEEFKGVTGSLVMVQESISPEEERVEYIGMIYPTMDSFLIMTETGIKEGSKMVFKCKRARWMHGSDYAKGGLIKIQETGDKIELVGECITNSNTRFTFNSTNTRTHNFFFAAEEAGLRAKFLIGQSKEKYETQNVVSFAIADYPYSWVDCPRLVIDDQLFPPAPGPEPGVLVAGKDGEHCAILDNEGTKFIHTNPTTKKVTYESIAVLSKYFPNGFTYKRYAALDPK